MTVQTTMVRNPDSPLVRRALRGRGIALGVRVHKGECPRFSNGFSNRLENRGLRSKRLLELTDTSATAER